MGLSSRCSVSVIERGQETCLNECNSGLSNMCQYLGFLKETVGPKTDERFVDFPIPQHLEEIVEVGRLVPQEHVRQRFEEHLVDVFFGGYGIVDVFFFAS